MGDERRNSNFSVERVVHVTTERKPQNTEVELASQNPVVIEQYHLSPRSNKLTTSI